MSTEDTTPAAVPDEPVIDVGFLSLPAGVQQAAEAMAAEGRAAKDNAKARTLITSALLGELSRRLSEYENAITWDTSCTSCARVLDSSIRETERAEAAEAERDAARAAAASDRGRAKAAEGMVAAVRAVLLEGGQDAESVRRRAIAIVGTEEETQ